MTGLQGKAGGKGDFTLGSGAQFAWQHHARWHSTTEISIYDNASQYRITVNEPASRSIRLSINTSKAGNFTVSLLQTFSSPTNPLSGSQGSFQYLANGNYWVGNGDLPIFTEFSPSGAVLSQFQTSPAGGDCESYRSFKANFTTNPSTTPDIAIQNGVVYMSWNGATQVKQWKILSGSTASNVAAVKTIAKTGFETSFTFSSPFNPTVNFTRVDALDASGKTLKSSQTIKGNFQSPVPKTPKPQAVQGRTYI